MTTKNPLEKEIEKAVCNHAKSLGWYTRKFTSPSHRSVPDQLMIPPSGKVMFVEFKALGKKPTVMQYREHEKLHAVSAHVFVIDNIEDGVALVNMWHNQ